MKTKIFAMAIAALALAACNKNNDDFTVDNLKDTPITIASAGVADLTTRAIYEGQLIGSVEENVSISVWVEGSADKYRADNMNWQHPGTSWYSESTVLYEGSDNQTICALSPYREDATIESGVTITADGVTDYLVASESLITSNPVNINMAHAMTKLVLCPTFGSEATGETIATVEVQNMHTKGTLNINTNSWHGCEGSAPFTMTNNQVIVVPMESCQSFPMVITMDSGRIFKATISLAAVGNKLESGTQYEIKLQLGKDIVAPGGITAKSWGTPISGGDLATE